MLRNMQEQQRTQQRAGQCQQNQPGEPPAVGNRCLSPQKRRLPPMLRKIRANILVAIAARGSMPNWNITGTVISEVLPVMTLMELVTKKTNINHNSGPVVIHPF